MHLFRKKLERYRDLVAAGKHSTAAREMGAYLQEGLEEKSDAEKLVRTAARFDTAVAEAKAMLEQGMPEDALGKISELEGLLRQVKLYADLVAKDEEDLE